MCVNVLNACVCYVHVLNVCACVCVYDVHALYERVCNSNACVFVLVSQCGNTMCITLSYAKTG